MIRCGKCGGDMDTAMHCTRCGQPPVTYTSVVPAAPQCGAIEEILRLLDVYGSLGYEGVPQARAELAVLQATNARMREALDHAARCLTAIAIADTEEGNECLKDVRDTRRFAGSKAEVAREALSTKPEGECVTPAPAGARVTLEQLLEIEWAPPSPYSRCPVCARGYGLHADDCWLAAAILDAEGEKP